MVARCCEGYHLDLDDAQIAAYGIIDIEYRSFIDLGSRQTLTRLPYELSSCRLFDLLLYVVTSASQDFSWTTEGQLYTPMARSRQSSCKLTDFILKLKLQKATKWIPDPERNHRWRHIIRIRLVDYLPSTNRELTDSKWHPFDSNVYR